MSLQPRAMHPASMGQSPRIPTSPVEMFVPVAFCQPLGVGARGFRLTALVKILNFVGLGLRLPWRIDGC
jgi:hypothetical protein